MRSFSNSYRSKHWRQASMWRLNSASCSGVRSWRFRSSYTWFRTSLQLDTVLPSLRVQGRGRGPGAVAGGQAGIHRVLPQGRLQDLPPPRQAGAHRAEGDLQGLGDLLVREPLEVVEDD